MIILKMAFRNIFRQKRRSIFTILTMSIGFFLLSFSISISDGTYGNIINAFTHSGIGHAQINKKGYRENYSIYKTIKNPDSIIQKAKTTVKIKHWAPKVYSSALAFIDTKTTVTNIIGIDPEKEFKISTIKNKIKEGKYLSKLPKHEIMLGGNIAKILKAKLNSKIVFIAQGADGSIANQVFTVKAILKGDNNSSDKITSYMHIKDAQEYLSLYNQFHTLVLMFDHYSKSAFYTDKISKAINNKEIEVQSWQTVNKEFYKAMQADRNGMWISLLIIIIMVALGVLNSILMIILERTHEYGLIKALGSRPLKIFYLIILETSIIALISIFFGTIISLISNYFMLEYGINYPVPMEVGGMLVSKMYGSSNISIILDPAIVTFFTAIIVSIIPGIKASKIVPVKAMRRN